MEAGLKFGTWGRESHPTHVSLVNVWLSVMGGDKQLHKSTENGNVEESPKQINTKGISRGGRGLF